MFSSLQDHDVQAIQNGYVQQADGSFACLACGAQFVPGEVYAIGGRFFEAGSAVRQHVAAHGSWFETLLHSGNKYIALTEHQKNLMQMLHAGLSDAQIAAQTGAATATVRRQRYVFREKAKQARMYLALYNMAAAQKQAEGEQLVPLHDGIASPTAVDDRFFITEQENEKILKNAFDSMEPLRLKNFPAKEKKKIAVLNVIAKQFEKGRQYSEKQVNKILKDIYGDYVTLRRYLIEYDYLDREADGSRYWVR